ncbi:hypothetical protein E2C01_050137 [Portunus trituberculatus]|uniref:Uncharacterized protein n=1 Tax=Portunus trituberculatus TaxID=210409 RepID=A0A5B7GI36_PORTR|nr:hypothetical protein [Portunus trituberculatus]
MEIQKRADREGVPEFQSVPEWSQGSEAGGRGGRAPGSGSERCPGGKRG